MNRFLTCLLCCLLTLPAFAQKTKDVRYTSEQRQNFSYYYYDALRCFEQDSLDQALLLLRHCETMCPDDAATHAMLGDLYEMMKAPASLALAHYHVAVTFAPEVWEYRRRYVELLANSSLINNAINVTRAELKRNPANEDAWEVLAIIYKHQKHYSQALDAYGRIENLLGINEYVSLEKYRLYGQMNKPQKAIEEIDRLVDEYPTEGRYKVLRGDLFMQQDRLSEAYETYQKVLAESPENPFVYMSLANYYNTMGDSAQANACVMNALENRQLDLDTKLDILGKYVGTLGRQPQNAAQLDTMLLTLVEQYPLEERTHGYYAMFLLQQKRQVEAEQTLHTMLDINPKNERTWQNLIDMTMQTQNYSDVLNLTQRALENIPNNAQWYYYRCVSYVALQNYAAALQANDSAMACASDDELGLKMQLLAMHGDICYKMGNRQEAYNAYEDALRIDPQNVYVFNNYAYYLSLDSTELKKAERMSAKTVEKEPQNAIYLDTYAWILYKEGNSSLAKFYMERALENLQDDSNMAEYWEHYAYILQAAGDTDKAREYFDKAAQVKQEDDKNAPDKN